MPSLEEKYAHTLNQMVFNFKIWAVFIVLCITPLLASFILPEFVQSLPFAVSNPILTAALLFFVSWLLPNVMLKHMPFNYHNDNGRMTAYRFKLFFQLTLNCLTFIVLSTHFANSGFDNISGLIMMVVVLKTWKLRPSKGEWVSFRMRYRAGRTMPVKKRDPRLA